MNKLISIFFFVDVIFEMQRGREKKQVNKKFYWEICNRNQQLLVHTEKFTVPKSSWQEHWQQLQHFWTTNEEFLQFSMDSHFPNLKELWARRTGTDIVHVVKSDSLPLKIKAIDVIEKRIDWTILIKYANIQKRVCKKTRKLCKKRWFISFDCVVFCSTTTKCATHSDFGKGERYSCVSFFYMPVKSQRDCFWFWW